MINEVLITKPILSEKVWGNNELNNLFNYNSETPLGEIWLYSPYKKNESILSGLNSKEVYGKASEIFPNFKLLIKLIYTSKWLSVQLHPNDTMAKKLENEENGKTEAWFFLKDNGRLKISNENKKIIDSLKNNDWNLKEYEMNKNDIAFIPAGTIHTLGPNSMILEVQQSSNITYRLYDWGRKREIHIDKAIKVLENVESNYSISRKSNGFESKYFNFNIIENVEKEGFGVYVSLKDFTTLVLPENIKHKFTGQWFEVKK
ncbi:mannose-6-phosphate isomerase [Tepiditoga spiralis]|uniref:Mannose-6-phosphate isomerase n=1 Tax=Tepiditoga spiralis TaxID=2108365 RepID=A0A7G1G2E0_9BACT|nr:type I phosphomannose isomerase catalytic subunit [Tepiditoga spiralis]BBE30510.1 mannose-6-phosphate isomerase [Tepiditoga spiralis]